ncbi:hypothetical protein DACRYDRAFT_111609 [Dacryopinax primogenitus]|uniref:Uncharacterized protein n=1 Tax=Dacryopinax primogenitus (strain DJM 731) TaxID=1858805 RepID=M5FW25_DACPD|nr:uncharacterized protein DACRYDRAFT_111609 [Dacryopinax primogenitus]EJT97566.1 hypothetical protein DACRYDRAFT_111609 [Dacryopinax primogenitus]
MRNAIERQLGTLELLTAVYCAEGELILQSETGALLPSLKAWTEHPSSPLPSPFPSELKLLLNIKAEDHPGQVLKIDILLPLSPAQPQRPKLKLRQPVWLSRSESERLAEVLSVSPHREDEQRGDGCGEEEEKEEGEDDLGWIMSSLDRLQAALPSLSSSPATPSPASPPLTPITQTSAQPTPPSQVLRTWHHLPSLSTRSKRTDLVQYAQSHHPPLTGFVLAGKPGLVVLEYPLPPSPIQADLSLASAALDRYWSTIRSQSWADIPPSHKKVSERLREVGQGAFGDMREVTRAQEVGGERMGGEKGNRQDLASVGRWLEGCGVGGRLERVLGAEWT